MICYGWTDAGRRGHYNTVQPHALLGYQAPAMEVLVPAFVASPTVLLAIAKLAQPPTLN
jgi:hypothetical protein